MQITLSLPDYRPENGFESQWEEDFEISLIKEETYIRLLVNKEGLISLAKQLLYLAQDVFPKGYHLHYDDSNSLETGSSHLVVEKC